MEFGLELRRLPQKQEEIEEIPIQGEDSSYYSCWGIQNSALTFNGCILDEEKNITMCCEPIMDIPRMSFEETAMETLEKFMGMRTLLIHEGKYGGEVFTSGCRKCAYFCKGNWSGEDGLIHFVNLSMYPSPCQCQCSYCGIHASGLDKMIDEDATGRAYEKLFSVLELAESLGLISKDANYQVACGEITIHPYRQQIMSLVQGKHVRFLTNCFKYDEDIADMLHNNIYCSINLSIDAGTPETWHRIKGFHNFDIVLSNLKKYKSKCIGAGQITFKYIVLPGINDSNEDYLGLIKIMEDLEIKALSLSRDTRVKYDLDREKQDRLIKATSNLVTLCKEKQYIVLILPMNRIVSNHSAKQ